MTKLTAKTGYKFARADKTAVYDTIMYLSDIDSKDNYIELTDEEAKALKEELEEKAMPNLR